VIAAAKPRRCERCHDVIAPEPVADAYDPWRTRLRWYCPPCRSAVARLLRAVPSPADPDPVWQRWAHLLVIGASLLTIALMVGHCLPG
jgi:hypothetical protein